MSVGENEALLGYVHAGWVRAEFMACVLQLQQSPARRLISRVSAQSGGTLISYGRNMLTEEFLGSPCQWMLMVDTDMTFTPGQVETILAAGDPVERPIISGVCATLNNDGTGTVPAIYSAERDETGTVTHFTSQLGAVHASGLMLVDGCGAAFLLIHRSVMEKIPPGEWFREGITPSGGIRGEDLAFCMRATEAGFPIWAHCGLRIGHMKTVCMTVD